MSSEDAIKATVREVGGGALGDRINRRIGLTACLLGHSVALFGLAFSTIICQVTIFATLHGVVWGARAPMAVSIRADYFGRSNYATIMGFSSLARMSGMMVGPALRRIYGRQAGRLQAGILHPGDHNESGVSAVPDARRPATASSRFAHKRYSSRGDEQERS